jgi:sugar (pentulose or hexulose) kinase
MWMLSSIGTLRSIANRSLAPARLFVDFALGIDIGTSGVRAAVMDRSGAVLHKAHTPMPPPIRVGGHLRQAPEIWWEAACETFDRLRRVVDFNRVAALAVDGTSGTIVAIDKGGYPLDLASMYNDTAADGDVVKVAAVSPPDTAARGASSPLARALAMQTTPGLAKIIHQADWIAGQLSGSFALTDENNALKTGYDPRLGRWPEWIAECGLDMALLPKVQPAGTQASIVSGASVARFGFAPTTAVVAGTTDGCAAFLATGADEIGAGVTSLGTTLTIKLLSETPVFSPEFGIYSHCIAGQWLAGGASNTGGAVLLHYFDQNRMDVLQAKIDPTRPTGLDYYPLLAPGERFPINDPRYPPRLSPRPKDDVLFFQGLLEGIAKIEQLAYHRLGDIGASPLTSLRTVGGGARNEAWAAIRQRLLGVPLRDALSEDAAAGTARLAWRGIGVPVAG